MTKRLIVLRHSKATHKPGFPDVDRPLTARGLHDADAAGEWLSGHQIIPDLVLCSSSRRTRETWERVALVLAGGQPAPRVGQTDAGNGADAGTGIEVHYDSRLYLADADETLEIIAEDPGNADTLLLVGHNPAAHQIVCRLTARNDMEFPTSALAVVGLSDWGRLAPGTGMIHSLWMPKSERA